MTSPQARRSRSGRRTSGVKKSNLATVNIKKFLMSTLREMRESGRSLFSCISILLNHYDNVKE